MRWEDERWVKVYTRDTGEWLALGWEAQALFLLLLRKSDRAGLIHSGRARIRGLAALAGMPLEVVERAVPLLLEDGCLRETDKGYLIPNFIAAQEAETSGAQRTRTMRERDRDKAMAEGIVSKTAADTLARMARSAATQDVTQADTRAVTLTVTRDVTRDVTQAATQDDTPRVDESRVEERRSSATQETSPVSDGGFALTSPPSSKRRQLSQAEALFARIQLLRQQRCEEVGEPFVPEEWPAQRQNRDLKPILAKGEAEQERFSTAWSLYLADDGQRARTPAWSFAFFISSGVRAKYETMAAREEAG